MIVFRESMTKRKAFKLGLTHRPKNATLMTRRQSDAREKKKLVARERPFKDI